MTDSQKIAIIYTSQLRIEKLLEKHEMRISKLEDWKIWVVGIAVGAGVALGAGGHSIIQTLSK